MQKGQNIRSLQRERELHFRHAISEQIRHPVKQFIQTVPGTDGDEYSIGEMKPQSVHR
jgi:hypothetical protein